MTYARGQTGCDVTLESSFSHVLGCIGCNLRYCSYEQAMPPHMTLIYPLQAMNALASRTLQHVHVVSVTWCTVIEPGNSCWSAKLLVRTHRGQFRSVLIVRCLSVRDMSIRGGLTATMGFFAQYITFQVFPYFQEHSWAISGTPCLTDYIRPSWV
jgi:hypothetical protein